MEKRELARKVAIFATMNNLFRKSVKIDEQIIERWLYDGWFIEYLIQVLHKAKELKGIDFEELTRLIKELEKIRYECVIDENL